MKPELRAFTTALRRMLNTHTHWTRALERYLDLSREYEPVRLELKRQQQLFIRRPTSVVRRPTSELDAAMHACRRARNRLNLARAQYIMKRDIYQSALSELHHREAALAGSQ